MESRPEAHTAGFRSKEETMPRVKSNFGLVWGKASESVKVSIRHGRLLSLSIKESGGSIKKNIASLEKGKAARINARCQSDEEIPGFPAAVATISMSNGSFSFFLRDINVSSPIFVPEYGVAVVPEPDPRGYYGVARSVSDKSKLTKMQKINLEPEENYNSAAAGTRRIYGRTTLGLGRDMRLFDISSFGAIPSSPSAGSNEPVTTISPKVASRRVIVPETDWNDLAYKITVSRGIGCVLPHTRRLEDGSLPILNQRLVDEDIIYDLTLFCSLETQPLSFESVKGTHFLVGDGHSGGHNLWGPEQEQAFLKFVAQETSLSAEEAWDALFIDRPSHNLATEDNRVRFVEEWHNATHRKEEPVLFCRLKAMNTASVPRYAWFAAPAPVCGKVFEKSGGLFGYEPESGFGSFDSGRVFCVARLNGKPLPTAELAVLLQPGAITDAEFLIPHRPIDRKRAESLSRQSFPAHHDACRKYWWKKLERDARIEVPERRIQEMIRACRLHLDMVMYGNEPDGVLAPSCGRNYSALAPESANMIQFLDSVGRHSIARRALDYFLEKQQPNGMIQNYAGHQSEPGVVLSMFAKHFRYTRDEAWLRERAPRLMKTADFLLDWRKRNMREELYGKGYGLIDGQSADMKEVFHGFAINASASYGLLDFAGVLAGIMPADAARLHNEASLWRQDLLEAVISSMELAPVVPLGDGSWTSSIPPYPENDLPACLDGRRPCGTHGTFLTRDNARPSALIFYGLFEPGEPRSGRILEYLTDIFHVRNVRHSQPYVSWHPLIHLRRGEVKAFLKSYYNSLASLADRETYTFWEHYHGSCPHKTEADGAFLMQTRWMLWLEEDGALALLPGIPRAWLNDGMSIKLTEVSTYFGRLSLQVRSSVNRGVIKARYELTGNSPPSLIRIRVPHPLGCHPSEVSGGVFDPGSESVVIKNPPREHDIVLKF